MLERPRSSQALVGAPFVHTRSLAEAEQIQSSISSPVRVEPTRGRTPFEWWASRLQLGDLTIVTSRYRAEVRASTANVVRHFGLLIPIRASGEAEQRGASALLVPGRRGAIASPQAPARFTLGEGYRGIQLSMPEHVLAASFESLAGVSGRGAPRFDLGVDLSRGGAAIVRLLDAVFEDVRSGSPVLTTPAVAARLADTLVVALLVGLPHTGSELLLAPRRASEPAALRRAEEYLAAHVDRAVSSAELATAVGVSGRTLFAAFRAHRDVTPVAFHRARRLDLARRRILEAPERSVTEVAFACGFAHLGRFSLAYRARFGESPSETRRAAGGR